MGFIDWIMKGVDDNEKETQTVEFDDKTIENLKNLSNKEMQESTTLTQRSDVQMQNQYNMQNANMVESQTYAQPYFQGGTQIPNNLGTPMSSQGYFQQQVQQQKTTITCFKIAGEEDVKFALLHLGKKSPCVINFEKMPKKLQNELLQFLKGGVYALGANMAELKGGEYLLSPRGIDINKQDRAKK